MIHPPRERYFRCLRTGALAVLALITLRCPGVEVDEAALPVTEIRDDPTPLENWVVVGPFAATGAPGRSGTPAAERINRKIQLAPPPGTGNVRTAAASARQMVDFNYLFGLEKIKEKDKPKPSFVLFARLNATAARSVYLLLGSDGGVTVKLNGRQIMNEPRGREFLYEEFHAGTFLPLQSGLNLLEVDVDRIGTTCGLTALVAPSAESAQLVALQRNRCFVRHLLVGEGQPVEFELRGAPKDAPLTVSIAGGNGLPATSVEVSAGGSALHVLDGQPDGVYVLTTEVMSRRFTCAVFKGDLAAFAATLRGRLLKPGGTTKDRNNIAAILHRIDALLAPQARSTNPEWERQMVYSLQEGLTVVAAWQQGRDPWREPGLHLRAFVSPLDGAVRHYRLFVPEGHDPGSPLPLAIVSATPTSAYRPFIDSAFVLHHLDAEAMAAMAAEYQMAVLWPGYPAEPYGNPAEFGHLEAVLESVRSDYAVDPERLYLLGTCRGGMIATMMAEAFPGKFAALGLLNPIVERRGNTRGQEWVSADGAMNRWLDGLDPLRHLDQMRGTAAIVAFDEGDPNHGTLDDAKEYLAHAQAAGVAPEFRRVALSLSHLQGWRTLFAGLNGKRRAPGDRPLPGLLAQVRTTRGPIALALADGFVVVQGTGGSAAEQKECARIADEYCDAWNDRYYARCRRMKDVEVDPETEQKYNLVLIGNARTNGLWRNLAPHFEVTPEGVKVDSRDVTMPSPMMYALCQHPRYPNRRLVLLGGAELGRVTLNTFDPATDGCYDLRVWSGANSTRTPFTVVDLGAAKK